MFNATGIILAGGDGSRMGGADKARLIIDSESIIIETVDLLRRYLREVVIVTNEKRNYPFKGVKMVPDEQPGCGPLMGLYCGLKQSTSDLNFVTACDMPFINPDLLELMINLADDYDVVVPVVNNFIEPLLACYHRRTLPAVKQSLVQNQHKMDSFYDRVKVRRIAQEQIEKVDPELKSFVNINTAWDLDRARRMVQRDRRNTHAG